LKPRISFFCPAYYDEKNLPLLIPSVVNLLDDVAGDYEIIIVEDGSPDNTGRVADDLAKKHKKIRVIHHKRNLGYGAALKTGFANCRMDFICYTDGDNQFRVEEFRKMLPLLEKADVVIGFRRNRAESLRRMIPSKGFNFMINLLFGLRIRDFNCAFKIYKKKVLDSIKIESSSPFINGEMLAKAKKKGFRIVQVAVKHYPREHGIASGVKPKVILTSFYELAMQFFRIGLGL